MYKYILVLIVTLLFIGCKHDPLVPVHDICFETEVLPVFVAKCSMCHSDTSDSEAKKYILTDYNSIISKNIDIANPEKSKLYKYMKGVEEHKKSITPAERAVILKWIQQGAKNDITCSPNYCDSMNVTYDKQVKKFFLDRGCLTCHCPGTFPQGEYPILSNPDSAKAYGRLSTDDNYLLIKLGFFHPSLDSTIDYFSECEKTIIRKWINSGAN